jgi:hypothetical protein
MATIDEDLAQIEQDVRRLKIEYEQFFGGGRARPPSDTQWRVESLMRRYNERTAELNYAQRFRFNNLAQTYAKYVEMWRKKTVQKETGLTQRHFGAAAKAVEAARASAEAAKESQATAQDPAGRRTPPSTIHPETGEAFVLSFSDPDHENRKVVQLYQKLIDARTGTGETAGTPSLSAFDKFVREKTKELKEKGGREIEYSVTVEGGRVKLRARISG